MNRRDLFKAFSVFPAITAIKRADIQPNDVIVVECDKTISDHTAKRIADYLEGNYFPNNKVLICGDGLKLRVLNDRGRATDGTGL